MKYAVVTSKTDGNTGLLAETVRDILPPGELIHYGLPADEAEDADIIFAVFWTNEGVCDGATADFLSSLEGKEVFLIGSAGWGDPDYFREILRASAAKLPRTSTVLGTFMCQGRMGTKVRERYEKLPPEKGKPLLENFDRALTHPDDKDLERLRNTVKAFL